MNLRNVPKIYHGPHPPPTGPVPARPLVPVRGGRAPEQRIDHVRGPRIVNGVAVQPLRPVGGSTFAGNGNGFGGALHRDFPVSRTTHEPVIGAPAQHTAPAAAFAGSGRANWRPAVTPASGVVLRSQAPQVPRATYVPPAAIQKRSW